MFFLYKNNIKGLCDAQNTREHVRSMRIAVQTIAVNTDTNWTTYASQIKGISELP